MQQRQRRTRQNVRRHHDHHSTHQWQQHPRYPRRLPECQGQQQNHADYAGRREDQCLVQVLAKHFGGLPVHVQKVGLLTRFCVAKGSFDG